MNDEITGAVVGLSGQVAQKSVDIGLNVVDKVVDNIAKLLQSLTSQNSKPAKTKETKETKEKNAHNIEAGDVGIRELVANARENGESIVANDGYSARDMRYIAKKCKEYGIPVAFTGTNDKDNICAHIRESDKPLFERICVEMMNAKTMSPQQEFANFTLSEWQLEGVHRELSAHDLSANFGMTQNGEYFCLYEKADEKAILMARDIYERKYSEVKHELSITQTDENVIYTNKQGESRLGGFYELKDTKSDK